jgi:hypothetical protein
VKGLVQLPDPAAIDQVEAPDGVEVDGVLRPEYSHVHAGHAGVVVVQELVLGYLKNRAENGAKLR